MSPKSNAIRKRKSKFINVQRHFGSCGPIAVANAIKWHGIETSYDAVLKWCTGVQAYHPRTGMWPFQLRYVLRTLRMNFRVKRKITIDDLDSVLNAGGSFILVYDTNRGGHAVFVDGLVEGGFRAWNRRKGDPPFFSRADLEKALEFSRKKGGLHVYMFQPLAPQKSTVQSDSTKA